MKLAFFLLLAVAVGADPMPEPLVGTSYCTFGPDTDCYASGWPACCSDNDATCPETAAECDGDAPLVGTSYCTFGPDTDCYANGWPACCSDNDAACPETAAECDGVAPLVGTSYCTFGPDTECYANGWPACCSDDTACPETAAECDAESPHPPGPEDVHSPPGPEIVPMPADETGEEENLQCCIAACRSMGDAAVVADCPEACADDAHDDALTCAELAAMMMEGSERCRRGRRDGSMSCEDGCDLSAALVSETGLAQCKAACGSEGVLGGDDNDGGGGDIVAICNAIRELASNPPAGLADSIKAAGGNLEDLEVDGAASFAAQLVTVAVAAAAGALVW